MATTRQESIGGKVLLQQSNDTTSTKNSYLVTDGVSTTSPNTDTLLEIRSTTQGVVLPSVTSATTTTAMISYNPTTDNLMFNSQNKGKGRPLVSAPAGSTPVSLPAGNGTNGQVLTSDGAGGTSWVTGAAGGITSITSTGGTLTVTSSSTAPNLDLTALSPSPAGNGLVNAQLDIDKYGRITRALAGDTPTTGLQSTSGTLVFTIVGSATSGVSYSGDMTALGTSSISYTNASLTVDKYGRVTAASSGSPGGGGTVTSITSPNNTLTIANSTTTPTIDLAVLNPSPVGNAIVNPLMNVDQYGRVTSASAGATPAVGFESNTGTLTFTVASGSAHGSVYTGDLAALGTTSNSYTNSAITVDKYGRITAASSGTVTSGTVTNVSSGASNTITVVNGSTAPILNLNTTGTAGTYTYPTALTTDTYGRTTSVTSGIAPVTSVTSNNAANIIVAGTTTPTIDLATVNSSLTTPTQYTNATVTVDKYGRVSAPTSGVQPVTTITGATGDITVANTTGTGTLTSTLSLSASGVTPGTYYCPTIIVDAKGRLTSVISIPNVRMLTFTTSSTWSVPTGVTAAKFTLVGAGGGGGFSATAVGIGSGGGSGAITIVYVTNLSGVSLVTVNIGVAGGDGITATATTVTYTTSGGTAITLTATAGSNGAYGTTNFIQGGAGGAQTTAPTGVSSYLSLAGANGNAAFSSTTGLVVTALYVSGSGGVSSLGGAGASVGTSSTNIIGLAGAAGTGSGSSGSINVSTTAPVVGVKGGTGTCIIEY